LDIDGTFWDHHSTTMELSIVLSAPHPQLYSPDYLRRIKCKERKTSSKGRRQTQSEEKLKQKEQKIEKEIENEKKKVGRGKQ
jgi:phosphoglycerate-specific signal transduction histidine kinase